MGGIHRCKDLQWELIIERTTEQIPVHIARPGRRQRDELVSSAHCSHHLVVPLHASLPEKTGCLRPVARSERLQPMVFRQSVRHFFQLNYIGQPSAEALQYLAKDGLKQIVCPVCANDRFYIQQDVLVNTRSVTFLGLKLLNTGCCVLSCEECTNMLFFREAPSPGGVGGRGGGPQEKEKEKKKEGEEEENFPEKEEQEQEDY
eukprot:g961.t1